jgi:hypothetical protein
MLLVAHTYSEGDEVLSKNTKEKAMTKVTKNKIAGILSIRIGTVITFEERLIIPKKFKQSLFPYTNRHPVLHAKLPPPLQRVSEKLYVPL